MLSSLAGGNIHFGHATAEGFVDLNTQKVIFLSVLKESYTR